MFRSSYTKREQSISIGLACLIVVVCLLTFVQTFENNFHSDDLFTDYSNETEPIVQTNCTNGTTWVNGTCSEAMSEGKDILHAILTSVFFNALVSGLFAGIVTIVITVLIEVFGPQVGGVMGTIPSTIIPAAMGFAIEAHKNPDFAERKHILIQELFVVPLAVFCNCMFLYVWKVAPDIYDSVYEKLKKRDWKNWRSYIKFKGEDELEQHEDHDDQHKDSLVVNDVHAMDSVIDLNVPPVVDPRSTRKYVAIKLAVVCLASLIVWFSMAITLVCVTKLADFSDELLIYSSIGFFILMVLFSVIVNWNMAQRKTSKGKKAKWWLILSRGSFTFVIIACSVILSGYHFTLVAGLFSVFPAIFLTTMVSLWLSQGEGSAINAASTMMVGTSALPIFAMIVCFMFFYLSIAVSLVASLLASIVLGSAPSYGYLYWRKKVAAKHEQELNHTVSTASQTELTDIPSSSTLSNNVTAEESQDNMSNKV